MKVGTDGVLLGAWAELGPQSGKLLDIGAGSGIIALMMAQRTAAAREEVMIDAVELDAAAHDQCVENFENSPWPDRLFCYHASLAEFTEDPPESYDHILSNPPFSPGNRAAVKTARTMARQYGHLPFAELLSDVSRLLTPQGRFSTIIPFFEEERFISLAARHDLNPKRVTRVRGTPTAPFKRSLLEFQRQAGEIKTGSLIIELERHRYSEAYRSLTNDFYLNLPA